jgi:signal transduction histidine kinase
VSEAPREKILIVENTAIHIDLLGGLLGPHHDVIVATSGERGLAQAQAQMPDLILLDIVMGGMDGHEVCRRLKEDAKTRDIPVIFLTSRDGVEDEERGFELGAVDYITKPFSPAIVKARVRTHLDLKRQRDDLILLTRMKNRFLAICAHDLRSPLASVATMIQMFLDEAPGQVPPERLHYIDRSLAATNQMLNLVSGLLDVAVIERGSFAMKLRSASLPDIVTRRIETLRPLCERKDLRIVTNIQWVPEFPLDADRVGQMFDNVYTNAIKYSPRGKTIRVRLAAEDGCARVDVQDEGPGIASDEQAKLFSEFQTAGSRPTGDEGSTGLGLWIVKKIVEAHGGRVFMTSTPGEGSTVSFALPMKRAVEQQGGQDRCS